MAEIKVDRGGYKPRTCTQKRLKEGMNIGRQALKLDEMEKRQMGSGLPRDWRNRSFRDQNRMAEGGK